MKAAAEKCVLTIKEFLAPAFVHNAFTTNQGHFRETQFRDQIFFSGKDG